MTRRMGQIALILAVATVSISPARADDEVRIATFQLRVAGQEPRAHEVWVPIDVEGSRQGNLGPARPSRSEVQGGRMTTAGT